MDETLKNLVEVKTWQKTVRINLLQGLVICARCGRKLRIQTSRIGTTYYREESHLRGYRDCTDISQSVRAETIDGQIAELVQARKLPLNWEASVRQLNQQEQDGPDPETERKEIRNILRLMRDNYERGLYDGEEYVYWQKVNALKEKLDLLQKVPESAIEKAARTLLDLRESWEWATKEERRELVRMMIEKVGVDVADKSVVWVKARPDLDALFQLVNHLRLDGQKRFCIVYTKTSEKACGIEEEIDQERTEVKILLPVSNNSLSSAKEHIQ